MKTVKGGRNLVKLTSVLYAFVLSFSLVTQITKNMNLGNPHISKLDIDHLYHLGITSSDAVKFSDVKVKMLI